MSKKIISYETAMTVKVRPPHPTVELPIYKEADERGDCTLLWEPNGNYIEILCRIADMGEGIGLLIVPYERDICIWVAVEDSNGNINSGVNICNIDDIYISLDTIITKAKVEMNKCPVCGKSIPIDKQERYSFAGRCCPDCLPEMKKQHEYPGWYN